MKLFKAGAEATKAADPKRYTGEVWTDDLADGAAPVRVHLARVAFSPGARTAWHTHPFGQILHVTSGMGLICKEGEDAVRLMPGDSVSIAPGERHWHGATPKHAFTHIAIQPADDSGRMADWGDPVDAEAYEVAAEACANYPRNG